MLPSITASKSAGNRIASTTSGNASHFEKSSGIGSPSVHPSTSVSFAAFDSSSAHGSPDITAILKTPAVSAKFAAFSSPDRRQRIDVQAMLNEIHSRPSMAGILGTGIVSALSAKTISETQTSKPLEVRANLDRFIRSKLQDVCSVKDDIIQSLDKKLEVITAEAARLERARAEDAAVSQRTIADLESKLDDALLASRSSIDDDGGDMSPAFHHHSLKAATPLEQSRDSRVPPPFSGPENDKDSMFVHLGLASRTRSADVHAYSHALGTSIAPQLALVAPAVVSVIEQLHRIRHPQKPSESSVIVSHEGELLESSDLEAQRQSLRRRMAKTSKMSEAIECCSKGIFNVVALEDVSHGGASVQPRRPALASAAVSNSSAAVAVAAATSTRRGSTVTLSIQTGRGGAAEDPLPVDLFLEQQQRADFISHATAAITLLPPNTCQDFIAEMMRQASCVGAGLAVACEAIAVLSGGDSACSFYTRAADCLQRACRVQRVQLYEIHWDSRSLVPIVNGKAQERDELGISQRIAIGQGYVGKCVNMGPQIVNFPASLGQDFQPSDRGEGVVALTMLAIPIGLPGQPPVMVASLINKLLPLGAPQQPHLEALQKGKSSATPFGAPSAHRPPPANADKPPFSEGDVVVANALAFFIAHKATRCRLARCLARLQGEMMARACAMGGAGVGGESVLNSARSQELCAAVLSDIRSAANWTCIDMMLVFPGPPIPLGSGMNLEPCFANVAGDERDTIVWGSSRLIVHVVREDVATSSQAAASAASRLVIKPVSEANVSQLQAQLATQWLPQNFRRAATLETKSLLQTQSQLLNQIVCVTVTEGVLPTEVGTDYAVIQNVDTGQVCKGGTQTMPLTGVQEIIRYACAETARGLAQCSAQGQALLSSLEDAAAGSWTLRYADQHFNPSAHVFARMEPSSPGIAACARPFNAGASSGRHTMFMPVTGAGGVVIGVLRAEKSVQAQSGEAHGSYFSEDEMEALEGASKHCGSILQAACVRLNDVSKKTLQGVLTPEFAPSKRSASSAADASGSNVVTPSWCVRSLGEKQRGHIEDLCLKACMSLQCSKVSVLLFHRDRQWLVQLAHAVLSSKQTVHVMHDQGDGVNVYEGYKHNGIAQVAISSCESVVVANVGSHVGYDSRLDALAGIQGRNCLAVPVIAGEAKASARCVGVLFATNKLHDGFTGSDVVLASAFADAAAATLAGFLDKMPPLRSLEESRPTPGGQTHAPRAVFELASPRADKDRIAVKRSEGESADVLELRSMLNAYGGI